MLLAAFASAAPASCLDRPDAEELISEPVIITARAPGADLASLDTFALVDSIPILTSLDAGASGVTADPAVANPTLDEIAAQLTSRGYQRVARSEGPDFGVGVIGVSKLNLVAIGWGGWWGGGGGSAYWGYSGSMTSGIGVGSVAAWQSGTLIVELYDLRAARDEARRSSVGPSIAAPQTGTVPIPVVWAALLHAVLGEAGATLDAPPIEPIRQAFIQSPYLARVTTPLEVP